MRRGGGEKDPKKGVIGAQDNLFEVDFGDRKEWGSGGETDLERKLARLGRELKELRLEFTKADPKRDASGEIIDKVWQGKSRRLLIELPAEIEKLRQLILLNEGAPNLVPPANDNVSFDGEK